MISEHAIIDKSAKIDKDVTVGPFTVIGTNVIIKSGTWIGSNVVIKGTTHIGKNNKIYQFATIGEDCQDKKYKGEASELIIGDRNVFREGCTIHRGTQQGGGVTRIGNDNLFMINSHIAHDCIIGNHTIFANNASIAGHVVVDDYASLGGFVGIHQFCLIGAHSFCAGGAIIAKDVLPFITVSGNPAKSYGLNTVGLERRNFSTEVIGLIRKAYKIIFQTSATVKEALDNLKPMVASCAEIKILYDFLQSSSRGIVR